MTAPERSARAPVEIRMVATRPTPVRQLKPIVEGHGCCVTSARTERLALESARRQNPARIVGDAILAADTPGMTAKRAAIQTAPSA